VLSAGYTSESDLQGEVAAESCEDSRDSQGDGAVAEKCENGRTLACVTECPETLSSKQTVILD